MPISAKLGQSLGGLLAKQRKTSERVLGEFCPARSLLGKGGIRQPRLSDPRRKRNGSWLAEADVRGIFLLAGGR